MRILFISAQPLDLATGSPIRARLMYDGLHAHGCSVQVLSPGPAPDLPREGIGYTPLDLTKRSGRAEQIREAARSFRAEAILLVGEALIREALAVARGAGIPIVVDLHALASIEAMHYQLPLHRRLAFVPYSLYRELALRKVDGVVAANPMLYRWVRRIVPRTLPVIGMAALERFDPATIDAPEPAASHPLRLLYAGNHQPYQGVDLLLAAYERLVADAGAGFPVHLKLIGAVGRAPALAVRLESLRRTGMVEVEGQVEFEAIPGLMRRADVCIIPRRPLLMNHLAMPQKLVDFMAAGRCIVATDLAPHAAILGESVAGILCPPTAGGIAAGIRGAFDPGRRAELGRRARAYAERHFDHRSQALRVLRFIESLRRA